MIGVGGGRLQNLWKTGELECHAVRGIIRVGPTQLSQMLVVPQQVSCPQAHRAPRFASFCPVPRKVQPALVDGFSPDPQRPQPFCVSTRHLGATGFPIRPFHAIRMNRRSRAQLSSTSPRMSGCAGVAPPQLSRRTTPPSRRSLMLQEFRNFLLKTNALALAVGVIIGAAVGKLVRLAGRGPHHAAGRHPDPRRRMAGSQVGDHHEARRHPGNAIAYGPSWVRRSTS